MAKKADLVQGYTFNSAGGEYEERNGTVCKIIARVEGSSRSLEYGPEFVVKFGDGETIEAMASELNPWFPV